MKAFALIRMAGGAPKIDREAYPYHGFAFCDRIGGWGAYLISGTSAEFQAIDGLGHVVGICAVTEGVDVKWAELDGVIGSAVREKIKGWLAVDFQALNLSAGWLVWR
jgi:hypothetical protein